MKTNIQFATHSPAKGQLFIVGDVVRLETNNLSVIYQLDVCIVRREGDMFIGNVLVVSPASDLHHERWELKRGDEVAFRHEHIVGSSAALKQTAL